MAIEWNKKIADEHYEVRSAGATRRLYTNNVFHSQYNPNNLLQGGVWDLLTLPAFAFTEDKLQRVLVLGVGGGTVLKQIQKYISPSCITGIELNPVHLTVAKKYFGLRHKSFELIEADAIEWLTTYQGEKFDLIIDDLFGHQEGVADRVVKVNKQWAEVLLKHLNSNGIVAINFGSNKELKNSAMLAYKKIANQFKTILRLTIPAYENAIGVFCFDNVNAKTMRESFQDRMGLKTKNQKNKLKYSTKIIICRNLNSTYKVSN